MYNPFRAHIVKFDDGKYAVRKLEINGWVYLVQISPRTFWWISCRNADMFTNLDDARNLLYKYKNKRGPDRGTYVK